ncbi:serine/threonine protein kinase, putative,protein kinase, putative [Trypanosoma cruzi marinkellei]|uniref:non-specific serine/threonine protein kinase n=1 Tax=Trypanosoma cruzi marinkellei TaxID=85056 RepID=K2MP88_TRYCR|nr:serine/threonine protein kinase, putative,protein kinase, putative [Trypanosoma cruzi marinkellei]
MEKFTKVRQIGKGNMGACALARNNEDGKCYVIKQIDLRRMGKKERQQSLNEAHLLSSLRHPNIINYVDSFLLKKSDHLCIVMEFADSGDLSARIKKSYGVNFRESQVLDWIIQLVLSLSYVHQRRILHRDIKSQNVFLTSQNILKLGDFGIARTLSGTYDQARTFVGTPYYLSPELILERPYDHRSDVWALGVVIYELLALKHPFNATSMKGLMQRILKVQYDPVPKLYTTELRNIVPRLLNREPAHRIKLEELLELPILQRRMQEWMLTDVMPRSYIETLLQHNLLPPAIAALRKFNVKGADVAKTEVSALVSTGDVSQGAPSAPPISAVETPLLPGRFEMMSSPVVQRKRQLVEEQNPQQQPQQQQRPLPPPPPPVQQQQQQQQQQLKPYSGPMQKPPPDPSYLGALRMPKRAQPVYLMYKNINGSYNSAAIPGAGQHGSRVSLFVPQQITSNNAINRSEPTQAPQLGVDGAKHPSLSPEPSHGHVDAGGAAYIPASNPLSNRTSSNANAVGGPSYKNQTDTDAKEGGAQQFVEQRARKRNQQGSSAVASCLNPFFRQPSIGSSPLSCVPGAPSMDIKAMLQRAALERAQRRAFS